MAYCLLALLGKCIQLAVFGQLRVSEEQHLKDKFWNFIFYKFIFIFGVMNVQYMDQVLAWVAWFSLLGFLQLMTTLSKDRFQYLSFSPSISGHTHIRLVTLLCSIQSVCLLCLAVCIVSGVYYGLNTFALMVAEVALVSLNTAYVLTRYAIHACDLNHPEKVWENRATYIYYTELCFELASLSVDFCHHLHMLIWTNTMLSMASLVISMQLRWAFNEIRRKVLKHRNYLRVLRHMMSCYPMASSGELLTNSDDCAICWDLMLSARKLPCGHLFHNSCLRSWLEQDTSCPTCRLSLQSSEPQQNEGGFFSSLSFNSPPPETSESSPQVTNHFFHFDGSRYISWLPSVSLEVSHSNIISTTPTQSQINDSPQLNSMVEQVQSMFPNIGISVIMQDLRATQSIDVTVDNIIQQRLAPAPHVTNGVGDSSVSSVSELNHYNKDGLLSKNQTERRTKDGVGVGRGRYLGSSENIASGGVDEGVGGLVCGGGVGVGEVVGGDRISDKAVISRRSELEKKVITMDDLWAQMDTEFGEGARFAKDSRQRQQLLLQRKREMVVIAKRRFLEKKSPCGSDSN